MIPIFIRKFFGKKENSIIVAENTKHLKKIIAKEIKKNGNNCDLNHIDVSNIEDMSFLFSYSEFNGDISKWNTSNAIDMSGMFNYSKFNGDISRWDVSNVLTMFGIFQHSKFNGNISDWDVSNVYNMSFSFTASQLNIDLSDWKPYELIYRLGIFENCNVPIPYWANYEDMDERKEAIKKYELSNELNMELDSKNNLFKRAKI